MLRRLAPFFLCVSVLFGWPLTAIATIAVQDAAGDHVLRIEWNSYPETLDPQRLSDISESTVAGLFFEGLTRIDEELKVAPGAAESWAFSPDGHTLTFHLHDGLTYSDGTPLTAERFRATFERICDPRTESPWVLVLFDVVGCEALFTSLDADETSAEGTPAGASATAANEAARTNLGVRALDERTLEVQFVTPAAYFPAAASLLVFAPARQEFIDAAGEEWWRNPAHLAGNGPFRVESIGNDGDVPSKMVFLANERYWAGRPTLDRIEYVMANEDQTGAQRLAKYRRGEVDMVWLAREEYPAVEADPELSRGLVITPRAATIQLGFNMEREPFQDRKVREAFTYAFDREAFCREIQHDICEPTWSWIPPGVPGHSDEQAFPFDPERARHALAESSYGGPEALPDVTWHFWGEGAEGLTSREGAAWLAAQYRTVLGIELNLVETSDDDYDALYDDPRTKPQLIESGWFQDYPDPQNWLSTYWTCDSEFQQISYCNPAFDALTARADAELDPETRMALYEEAERMLIADAPSIFLFNWTATQLVKPYVSGYVTTPMDMWAGWMMPLTIDVERPE